MFNQEEVRELKYYARNSTINHSIKNILKNTFSRTKQAGGREKWGSIGEGKGSTRKGCYNIIYVKPNNE